MIPSTPHPCERCLLDLDVAASQLYRIRVRQIARLRRREWGVLDVDAEGVRRFPALLTTVIEVDGEADARLGQRPVAQAAVQAGIPPVQIPNAAGRALAGGQLRVGVERTLQLPLAIVHEQHLALVSAVRLALVVNLAGVEAEVDSPAAGQRVPAAASRRVARAGYGQGRFIERRIAVWSASKIGPDCVDALHPAGRVDRTGRGQPAGVGRGSAERIGTRGPGGRVSVKREADRLAAYASGRRTGEVGRRLEVTAHIDDLGAGVEQ